MNSDLLDKFFLLGIVWKFNARIFAGKLALYEFFFRAFSLHGCIIPKDVPTTLLSSCNCLPKKLLEKGTVKLIVNISVLVTKVHVNFVQSDHLKVLIKCINLVHIASFL